MATYNKLQDPLIGVSNAGAWQDPNALGTYESGGQTYNTSLGDLPYLKLAAEMGLDVNALNNQLAGSDQANAPRSFDLNRAYSDAALQYLQSQGLTPKVAVQGSNIFTGLFDGDGNLVNYDKHDTGEDARADALGVAKIGAMALGAGYLMPGAEGLAAGADAGWGGLTAASYPEAAGLTAGQAAAGAGGYNLAAGQTAADVYGTEAASQFAPSYVTAAGDAAGGSGVIAGGSGINAGSGALSGLPSAGVSSMGSPFNWMNAAASIGAGLMGSDASRYAANTAADAAREANQTQLTMYNQNRADNMPLLDTRNSALAQINALLANPNDVSKLPGYQFGLDQGTRALNAGAAANGMTYSGAQGKALTRYGQDYAGTKLNESYNRLANLAGLGQVATNSNTMAGTNYANQVGNNLSGAASMAGGAALYNARNWGNALNSLGTYNGSTDWGNSLRNWGSNNGLWNSAAGGTGTPGGSVGVDPNYDWIG